MESANLRCRERILQTTSYPKDFYPLSQREENSLVPWLISKLLKTMVMDFSLSRGTFWE